MPTRLHAVIETPRSILDLRFSEFMWFLTFNALLFSDIISTYSGFSFLDEFITCSIALIAVVKVIWDWKQEELLVSPSMMAAFFSLVIFVCLGLLENYFWNVQTYNIPILIDLFTCIKYPLILLCSLYLFRMASSDLFRYIVIEAKILAVLLFILALVSQVISTGMVRDVRFGIKSFRFLCSHPTALVAMGVALTLVFLRDSDHNRSWIILSLIVIASSMRSKGLVFCILTLILLFVMRKGRKLNAIHVILCIIASIVIGWDQYVSQFQAEGYARTELTRASFEIASDYFPFGPGFGTFGSSVTGQGAYYSQLYYDYGISEVWGLAEGNTFFLSDTFWPTVIGQFGYLGLVVYLVLIGSLFVCAYQMAGRRRIVAVACFSYLLISSTAESAFFHPMSVTLGFVLGMCASTGSIINVPHDSRSPWWRRQETI